jgi:hypothetical protein
MRALEVVKLMEFEFTPKVLANFQPRVGAFDNPGGR